MKDGQRNFTAKSGHPNPLTLSVGRKAAVEGALWLALRLRSLARATLSANGDFFAGPTLDSDLVSA
jgi:hypothetical protein